MPRNGDAQWAIAPMGQIMEKVTNCRQNATRKMTPGLYILDSETMGRAAHAGTALEFRSLIG
jgi:hypothetical protein